MPSAISITESDIFTALGNVLLTFGFSNPIEIIRGQVNRVPEPTCPDYIIMWVLSRNRLATNVDLYADIIIKASINDNLLNVTSMNSGAITPGTSIYNTNLPAIGCPIICQQAGQPGSVGTYQVANAPNLKSQTFYCGTGGITEYTEMSIQCDIHGPCSGDNAQRLSTLFRDYFAVAAFQAQPFDISPLYADDARQVPFINAEDQYEERYIVDLLLQVNNTVTVTQQFLDQLQIKTIEADSPLLP